MEHPHIRGLSEWRPLARGGLALVWEARQSLLARLVAVKVYQHELTAGDEGSFAREAGAVGRLSDHPGIVTAYDAGVLPDKRPYLIMELCPGGSLTRWLDPENRPTEEQVRSVGIRIADALAAAHACGVIHRDVKPANILIDGFGHPRLADFGLATVAGTEAATARLRVTPAYAPPEAFGMVQRATEAGDVFSLAATLYALLAGSSPRSVDAAVGLEEMLEVATRPIAPLPGVNWFLMDALMTALSHDPAARPTAASFCDRLRSVPTPRTGRRGPLVAAADGVPRAFLGRRSVLAGHPERSGGGNARPRRTADAERDRDYVPMAEAPPRRARRRVGAWALAATLVAVAASAAATLITGPVLTGAPAAITQSAEPRGLSSSPRPSPEAAATSPQTSTTPGVGDTEIVDPEDAEVIRLESSAHSAKPFETVRISGTYRGGAATFVRVQRWEDGKWRAFPVPAKTDASGEFTAYVELAKPRRYRLRVLDPRSGVTSEPILLVIRR